MPSTSVKKLYVAKSMEGLNKEVNVDVKGRSTSGLVNSASKVFEAAERSNLDKDEEKAYVQYMRFIELVLLLKKRPDFTKDNSHKKILKSISAAIAKAEILRESLSRRYSILEEATCREKNEKNDLLSILHNNKPEVNSSSIPVISPIPESPKDFIENSISSTKLFSLFNAGQASVIIMDARPAKDFEDSHLKHTQCINIPQEILVPGITAAKLESQLPPESLSLWYKRSEVDYIILFDWDSKDESSKSVSMNALKQAITKWDQNCVLKRPPLVLQGGYKDWMLKYPMYTTQALNFEYMNGTKSPPVIADVSAVEYPNLDENSSVRSSSPSKENLDQPGILFKKSAVPIPTSGFSSPADSPDPRKSKSAPSVDRKSKPNIDRGLKSSGIERKQITNNNPNVLNKDRRNNSPMQEDKKFPAAVHKSKPANRIISDGNVAKESDLVNSLNKEESLAKENLELAKEQLRKEEEFEKLRLRKELEAEEGMRIEIQKQENILVERLKQLEIQSREKDAAYLKIKEENLKMKKLLDEQKDKEFQLQKEKEITEAESKRKSLKEEVDRLREERKKKEMLARKKLESSKTDNVPREAVSANTGLKRNPSHQGTTNYSEYSVPLSRQSSTDGGSRGLVRSHSSPNIAQMVNQEENAQRKIPVVDRSLKPKATPSYQINEINRARHRNLHPVYGNSLVRPATGLRNLGNTCFMNSIIQCLSNTIPLADYFNSGQYMEDICRDSKQGTGGELAEEFAVVIRALWMGQYKSFSPKDFKNTVSKCLSVCIGNEQQDSHEFLVVLMEKLHADLNKRSVKNVPKLESCNDENSFWQHHRSYNSSKISDVFEGLLRSTLTCLSCRKTSDSYEVFSCLSLPILSSRCSLKDCFQHFLKPEKISGEAAWDCPRCKQKKEAEKCLRICRLPAILVFQLKRFSYEGLWRRKLQTHVDFDLSFEVPCEKNSEESSRTYSLYGIVNHYGTLEGGHYTAFCKTTSHKWYRYDDHELSEISVSDIKTPAAYLLFYCAVDFHSNL